MSSLSSTSLFILRGTSKIAPLYMLLELEQYVPARSELAGSACSTLPYSLADVCGLDYKFGLYFHRRTTKHMTSHSIKKFFQIHQMYQYKARKCARLIFLSSKNDQIYYKSSQESTKNVKHNKISLLIWYTPAKHKDDSNQPIPHHKKDNDGHIL